LECAEQIRAARASHADNLIYVNDLDAQYLLDWGITAAAPGRTSILYLNASGLLGKPSFNQK
jgi:hypothetical protein